MTTLNNLAALINGTATKSGFWEDERQPALDALEQITEGSPSTDEHMKALAAIRSYIESQPIRNMGEMLMLQVSELAEGLEEHRDGKPVFYVNDAHGDPVEMDAANYQHFIKDEWDSHPRKPEGLSVELADCLIRILDTMASLGVNIDATVAAKMVYNGSREYKHGKAY